MLALLDDSSSESLARVLRSDQGEARLQSLIELVEETAPSEALVASQRLLALRELAVNYGDTRQIARCHRGRARALAYLGRYEDAIIESESGRAVAIGGGEGVEAARLLLASLHPLVELGRLDEAIAAGTTARNELDRLNEPALAARADINIGITLQRMERNEDALKCFARAGDAMDATDAAFGPLQSNRGESLVLTCDFQEAALAFESALHVFRDSGVALHAAIAEGNLGDLAMRRGLIGEALSRFEHARQAFESAGAATHLARVVAEQAEAKAFVGLDDEAFTDFTAAISMLDEQGQVLERSRAQHGLARLLIRLGRIDAAELHLQAASAGFAQLNHTETLARVDLERAALMLAGGQLDEASALANSSALKLQHESPDRALAQILLGRITAAQGRLGEAEALYDLADAIVGTLDIGLITAELAEARGDLHSLRGDHGSAAKHYMVSIELAERFRGSLHAQRFRMAAVGRARSVHERLLSALLDAAVRTVAQDTFLACERTRNRSLVEDSMATAAAIVRVDEQISPQDADLQEARSTVNALYSRLHDEVGQESTRQRLRVAEGRAAELESRRAAATSEPITTAEPMEARAIQSRLDEGTTIASFFVDRGSVLLHVLDRECLQLHERICPIAKVESLVEQLQFQIGRVVGRGDDSQRARRIGDRIDAVLVELFDLLLRPALKMIPHDGTLVIIPAGIMQQIPFAALRDGSTSLIERCEVVVCPSISLFGWLNDQPRRDTGTALVLGVADAQAPAIRDEAAAILECLSHKYDVVPLFRQDAHGEALLRQLPEASIVHLACHGRFDAARPHLSGLRLFDGWLPAWSLRHRGVGANLITLAACDSGLTTTSQGGEMHGLAREFLVSGAKNVLGTLWPVADEPIRGLLVNYYRELCRQHGRALTCLRVIQRDAIRRGVPVWDWAALSLIGAG